MRIRDGDSSDPGWKKVGSGIKTSRIRNTGISPYLNRPVEIPGVELALLGAPGALLPEPGGEVHVVLVLLQPPNLLLQVSLQPVIRFKNRKKKNYNRVYKF
jgi:hypothetical protein